MWPRGTVFDEERKRILLPHGDGVTVLQYDVLTIPRGWVLMSGGRHASR
jgi:hypothetical protein